VIIDRAAYDAMIEHMKQADPREGVGLLAGPKSHLDHVPHVFRSDAQCVDRWVPLENVHEHPRARFELDPAAQIAAYEACDADGRWPWILVHSHTRTSAAPSETDIRYAVDLSLLHMVVSLAGLEPVAVLWRLDPTAVGVARCRRVRFQVVDLGFQANSPTDLTHGVSGA
jgi:proteasome lid subunit RPN8/RPN11